MFDTILNNTIKLHIEFCAIRPFGMKDRDGTIVAEMTEVTSVDIEKPTGDKLYFLVDLNTASHGERILIITNGIDYWHHTALIGTKLRIVSTSICEWNIERIRPHVEQVISDLVNNVR